MTRGGIVSPLSLQLILPTTLPRHAQVGPAGSHAWTGLDGGRRVTERAAAARAAAGGSSTATGVARRLHKNERRGRRGMGGSPLAPTMDEGGLLVVRATAGTPVALEPWDPEP